MICYCLHVFCPKWQWAVFHSPIGGSGWHKVWHLVPTSVRIGLLSSWWWRARLCPQMTFIRLPGSENWRWNIIVDSWTGRKVETAARTVQTASRSCRLCETGVRGDMLSISIYISPSQRTQTPFDPPPSRVAMCSCAQLTLMWMRLHRRILTVGWW